MTLSGLPWVGGKAREAGAWIVSELPADRRVLYIEPCGGMLGILLQRPPARAEIANDLDGVLTNFWLAVRDHPDELAWAVRNTPRSRAEFDRAAATPRAALADGVEGARLFVVRQATVIANYASGGTWLSHHMEVTPWHARLPDRIADLAARLADVTLECRDAVELIAEHAHRENAVIYVDPPYRTAGEERRPFYAEEVDVGALTDVLRLCRGRVAISGYEGEWDHLGWRRVERAVRMRMGNGGESHPRREVLWCNYESQQLRLDLS